MIITTKPAIISFKYSITHDISTQRTFKPPAYYKPYNVNLFTVEVWKKKKCSGQDTELDYKSLLP